MTFHKYSNVDDTRKQSSYHGKMVQNTTDNGSSVRLRMKVYLQFGGKLCKRICGTLRESLPSGPLTESITKQFDVKAFEIQSTFVDTVFRPHRCDFTKERDVDHFS